MKKKVLLLSIIVGFLISLVSAEMILNEPIKDVYNLGDTISLPVKISSLTSTYGIFQMNLICNGREINFYKNGISLVAGEEKIMESSLPLIEEVIGDLRGICKIKAALPSEYILTEEFKISELIEMRASTSKDEFSPEEKIIISGNATKESGTELNGFVEITFSKEGLVEIKRTETISSGKFSSEIIVPKTMEAGEYVIGINAYEKNPQGKITNKGFANYATKILQVPTSLEVFFEKEEINPGETLRVKAILHDQTGEKIDAQAVISIKDEENNILEQVEKRTDEFLEYQIKEQQIPEEWKVIAVSNKLTGEGSLKIMKLEKVDIEIINRTIMLTNTGNVFYNKTILVRIGEEPMNIDAVLEIGESKKYSLEAPNGEYNVKVSSPDGKEVQRSVILTGSAISVEEISESAAELIRRPFVWIFIAVVLGGIAFLLFRKGYKRSFFGGHTHFKETKKPSEETFIPKKESLVSAKNRAHHSMAIKGAQQKANAVCIRIKNYAEVKINKGNAKETLQKIVDMAENAKAAVYESNECLFFLFIPSATKTFQGEVISADLAQSAKKILDEHNRLFKQKISYGISAEHGDIVAKKEGDTIMFMGLGNFMTNARKLASVSQGEVLVGEKLKDKISSDAKLEKHTSEKVSYYTIKEIKDKEKHQKFLSSFMKRQGKEYKIPKEEPKETLPEEDFDLE